MTMNPGKKLKGFTLLEMVLVMAIMASVLVAILGYTTQKSDEVRRDRLVMQLQQVLNAGLAYYVNLGSWPATSDLSGLQTNHYLPSGTFNNPWGSAFSIGIDTTPTTAGNPPESEFYACTSLPGAAYVAANVVASRLPFGQAINGSSTCPPSNSSSSSSSTPTPACTSSSTTCTIVASVSIPGQNLSNARSVNFAGLYHNGACVPVPECPGTNMTAEVVTVPVSVVGTPDMVNAYPISSFTATVSGAPSNTPALCPGSTAPAGDTNCYSTTTGGTNSTAFTTGNFWRVCLKIVTGNGVVNYKSANMNAGIILALTRCTPNNEPAGSDFTVFEP
jgi:prepilin-type N-terminal cleavage/methylation domain-containing protein